MQNAQGIDPGKPLGDGGAREEMAGKAAGVFTAAKTTVSEVAAGLKAQGASAVDERKGTAAQTLGTVAQALRGAAQDLQQGEVAALGGYVETAAQGVDKAAAYLRDKDLKGLTRDAEVFARRHPEVFLGGAFLAGILAARFLKSSRPRTSEGAATEAFNPPHFASPGAQ